MATKKVGVKVYGIKWDTDGEDVKLPKTTEFKVSDLEQYLNLNEATDEEIADTIGEILSNEYGFCHEGFKWRWTTKKMTAGEEKAAKEEKKLIAIHLQVAKMCAEAVAQCDADMVGKAFWDDLDQLLAKYAK